MAASAPPQRNSKPSVSSVVRIPFSKHSIANEIVQPAPIVSRPYSLQTWLAWIRKSRSLIRFIVPNDAMVSYSGRCVSRGYGYSGLADSTLSAPQASGQCQQA